MKAKVVSIVPFPTAVLVLPHWMTSAEAWCTAPKSAAKESFQTVKCECGFVFPIARAAVGD